jgi:hypothetical protein
VVNTDPFGYLGDPPPTGPPGPSPEGPKGAWWVVGGAVLSIVPCQLIGGLAVLAPLVVAFVGVVVIGLWDDVTTRRRTAAGPPAPTRTRSD